MSKSSFKSIAFLLSSLAVVLTICESANAQLRVTPSNSIPQGQESEFLQFQRRNNGNMREMRIMPDCSVGYGLGCNKTGTAVEKIINRSSGANYQDMLMRAAGGEDNYRKFATFYDNNPKLGNIPYASFWRNDDLRIIDSYENVLGNPVSRDRLPGLRSVTNNFAWSPSSRASEISPRDGLLNLKYAYGRVLFEEIAQIPNWQEQLNALDLPPDITQFYGENISQGLRYLRAGNEKSLEQSVLTLLSFPHSPGITRDGWFGRTPVDLPEIAGLPALPGDTLLGGIPLLGGGEFVAGLPGFTPGAVLLPTAAPSLLPYLAFLPLLLLLFNGGGEPVVVAEVPPDPIPDPDPDPETPPVQTIPEPSALNALLLLTVALGMLNYKNRFMATKS